MSKKDFVIENGMLISYKGSDESVEIPAEVEKIGTGAFENNRKIKEVVFACKNLKSIEEDAFYDCTSLEGIKIPEGTVQIAKRAFRGCTNMEYIYIPESVMIIGAQVADFEVPIFGKSGSFAEKYASENHYLFKTDLTTALNSIERKKAEIKLVQNKSFDIFGEKVSVSNTLSRYHEILEYYNSRYDDFFEAIASVVPADHNFDAGSKNVSDIWFEETDRTMKRMERNGIHVSKVLVSAYTNDILDKFVEVYKFIIDAYKKLQDASIEEIEKQSKLFYIDAESKVTGLSYGYIGSGLGMTAYAFHEFSEKQKQRKKAYAVAKQQTNDYIDSTTKRFDECFGVIYDKIIPIIRKGTDAYLNALMKCELEYTVKHGLVDGDIKDKYDVVKSSELMQGLYEKNSPNAEYVVALALKLYPMNVSAHIYAIEKELSCDGLEELRVFLGLSKKLQPYKDKIKSEKFEKVSTQVLESANVSDGIKVIKDNLFLTEEEIKKILIRYSTSITQAFEKIVDYNPTENCNIKEKCRQELNMIIDKESCEFFYEYGVAPVKSSTIPQDARLDFEKLVDYLEIAINKKQDQKAKQLKSDEEALNSAETLEDYENAINSLSKISGYKNATELLDRAVAKKQALADSMLGEIENEIDMAKTMGELNGINSKVKKINEYVDASDTLSVLFAKKNKLEQKENRKKLFKILSVIGVIVAFVIMISIYSNTAHYREFKGMVDAGDFNYITHSNIRESLKEDERFNKWAKKTLAKKLTEYQVNDDFDAAIYLLINHSTSGRYSSLDIEYNNYLDIGANKSLIQWLIINSVEKGEFISGNEFTVECKSENGLKKYEVSWLESKNSFQVCEVETEKVEKIFLNSGSFAAGENIDYSERMKKAEEKIEKYKLAAFEAEQAPKKESYEKAVQLLNEGKKAAAAIAFAKAEDYLDARERSFALWDEVADRKTLLIGDEAIIGLRSDGSIIKKYRKKHSQKPNYSYITESKNYIAVSAGDHHSTYLCDNGRVYSNGYVNWVGDPLSEFTDIVAISACYDYNYDEYTVGLKYDGTVVSVPNRKYDKREGVKDWTDIIAVSAGYDHTVGLKSDGTVVAVGKNDKGQCNVGGWTDIIAVSAGNGNTVGLKSDGTVVAVGNNSNGECAVSDWSNIVAISAGNSHTVGLRADGTVVATKYTGDSEYYYGECEVDGWSNIVAVSASGCHTIGLKSDGTIVLVGGSSFEDYDVPDCNDIKIPNN